MADQQCIALQNAHGALAVDNAFKDGAVATLEQDAQDKDVENRHLRAQVHLIVAWPSYC